MPNAGMSRNDMVQKNESRYNGIYWWLPFSPNVLEYRSRNIILLQNDLQTDLPTGTFHNILKHFVNYIHVSTFCYIPVCKRT